MTPPKTNLTLTIELPCSCIICGAIPASKNKTPESIEKHASTVKAWLADLWGRHDCYLVSSSNPNGLNPRK